MRDLKVKAGQRRNRKYKGTKSKCGTFKNQKRCNERTRGGQGPRQAGPEKPQGQGAHKFCSEWDSMENYQRGVSRGGLWSNARFQEITLAAMEKWAVVEETQLCLLQCVLKLIFIYWSLPDTGYSKNLVLALRVEKAKMMTYTERGPGVSEHLP